MMMDECLPLFLFLAKSSSKRAIFPRSTPVVAVILCLVMIMRKRLMMTILEGP